MIGKFARVTGDFMSGLTRLYLSTRMVVALSGVLIFVIGVLFLHTLESGAQAEARDDLRGRVTHAAWNAERSLAQALSSTQALAAQIRHGRGEFANFDLLAGELLRHNVGLRSLAIAPQGVARAVYPESEAAAALNRNVLADADDGAMLQTAARARTLAVLGPARAADGSLRLTGVMPVFVQEKEVGVEYFWGFVLAEIDVNRYVESLALPEALGSRTRFALVVDHPEKGRIATLAGEPEALTDPVIGAIAVPGARWQLLAESRRTWGTIYRQSETYVMLGLLLALTAMLFLVTAQRGQMASIALHDGLTGLPNRRLFYERAAQALAQARRIDKQVAFLFVDVNRFKSINDEYGHAVGDAVLAQVAQRLRTQVRETDTVARFAGDEYVIVLNNIASRAEAHVVVRKIAHAMEAPVDAGEVTLTVRVTVGCSVYPLDGHDVEELLKKADQSMYRVKHLAA